MTAIEILDGDWEVLLEDEKNQNGGSNAVVGMRTIQKKVASPTIVTTRALYSAVAAAIDDFVAMGFRNAMSPVTPNAFSLPNQYFIPRESMEFLKEGAITQDLSYVTSPDEVGNGVIKIRYTIGTGTDFATTDIGRQVIKTSGGADNGDSGTLLAFDRDHDGKPCAWIRPDNTNASTGDLFEVDGGTLSATGDSGTGTGLTCEAGESGECLSTAVQVIGSVPTATEVYIYQDRIKLQTAASGGSFQWWDTDPDVSLGIVSILVMVKNMGSLIAEGDLEVFARRYTSLYDNFRLNVAAGGFQALPLASSADINNTTGVYTSGTLSGVTGSPTVGNAVYVGASWAAATAKGIITAVNGSTDFDFYLIGDLTAIGSTTAVTGYEFDTPGDDGFSATTGTVAALSGGPADTSSGEGGSVTIAIGHIAQDYNGDTNNEPYSITIDCKTNVPIAKVYERLKYITRRGADETELFGLSNYVATFDASTDISAANDTITETGHEFLDGDIVQYDDGGGSGSGLTDGNDYYVGVVDSNTIALYATRNDALADENREDLTVGSGASHTLTRYVQVPGESYRGITGFYEWDANSGTFNEGDKVDDNVAGGWTARSVGVSTSTWQYVTVTDEQTSIDSIVDDDLMYDEDDDTVTLHGGGTYGIFSVTSPKAAPFGTFTGTQIFGAPGVYFDNTDNDPTSYILTDDLGTLNSPPTTISFTVGNTIAGDRVFVARDTGTDGVIDKDQHGGLVAVGGAYNDQGDIIIKAATALDSEVPQAGYVRIVENTLQQEHHYKYASRVLATSEFTLVNIPASTVDATDTTGPVYTLTDTASGDFVNDGVEPGMLIRNTTTGEIFEVTEVTSATVLQTVGFLGSGSSGWTSGNGYEINKLIQAYGTGDDLYDLILDQEATTTSVSNTFTKTPTSPFDVVVNVRQAGSILPFTQNQEVGDSNVTVTTVRQPDTIYQ